MLLEFVEDEQAAQVEGVASLVRGLVSPGVEAETLAHRFPLAHTGAILAEVPVGQGAYNP